MLIDMAWAVDLLLHVEINVLKMIRSREIAEMGSKIAKLLKNKTKSNFQKSLLRTYWPPVKNLENHIIRNSGTIIGQYIVKW